MSQVASKPDPDDIRDRETLRELANSDRESAWIYELYLEYYSGEEGLS